MIKIDHLQKECRDAPGMGEKIWDKASSDGVFAASPLQGCWVPEYMHVCQASGRQGVFPSWEPKLNLFPFQNPTYGRFDSPQVCLHIFAPSFTRILQQERGVNAASSSLPAAGLGFHMGKNIREVLDSLGPGENLGIFFLAGMGDGAHVNSTSPFGHSGEDFGVGRTAVTLCRMLAASYRKSPSKSMAKFPLFTL